MNHVRIADRPVGPGRPCFVVAEVGLNHNGDMDLAIRSIDAAADAGADGVKFQNYRVEDFLSDRTLTHEYVSAGRTVVESQWDMFLRCQLDFEQLTTLKAHCDRRGVVFHGTPTGPEGIADLVRLESAVLKNGSDFLGHLPVVRALGRTGLPTVLSTGMATLAEVDEAVRAFRETGNEQLILLHCTSSYPTPPDDVHLRKMTSLATAFECPVGFSDHTDGTTAAIGAVALGACWIEKHFTLDRDLPGPDHRFSSDPAELRRLVEAVRTMERSLGSRVPGPSASEAGGRRNFRLSCVTRVDLPAGHRLCEGDLAYRRPGTGLPPAAAEWIVGRTVATAIPAGRVLVPEDLQ